MLDVFSGRSNPIWQMTFDEDTQLRRRVQGLTKPAPAFDIPQAGWRGFVVFGNGLPGGEQIWLRVKDDVVEVLSQAWRDTTGIESFLEGQARHLGHGALLDHARKH